MDDRRAPLRELAGLAAVLIALSRLADGPLVWPVTGLIGLAIGLGALQVLGERQPHGVAVEALILPALAAAGSAAACRVVPLSWAVPLAALAGGAVVLLALSVEARDADRTSVLGLALLVGFVGFVGAAALVPGGLAEPGLLGSGGPAPLEDGPLILLALLDAALAGLLGYRLTALRHAVPREALYAATTYAAAVGIAAAALRALDIPLLLGPALLTVLLYLWDAWRATPGSVRRSGRWVWESALLAILAGFVVIWNVWARP
ncbi:MAG TPA: hypothetical protein VF763_05895 [Candidatus Limnocylindrales bacterium]